MTKSRIAEWIISQVLPPDRAASTVGDWMEDAPERGNVWFWSCVFRTAASSVWSDLTESPFTMARWGLAGFGRNILVPIGTLALMFFLLASTDGGNYTDLRYRHDWVFTHIVIYTAKSPSLPGDIEFRWPIEIIVQLVWASRLYQTSRWIARRAPGREVAACLSVALVGWLTILVAELWWRPIPSTIPMGIAHDLILLTGALWFRRRQLHPVG